MQAAVRVDGRVQRRLPWGAQRLLLTRIPSPGSGLGCWRSLGSAAKGWRASGAVGAAAQPWAASAPLLSKPPAIVHPGTNALTKPLGCEKDHA